MSVPLSGVTSFPSYSPVFQLERMPGGAKRQKAGSEDKLSWNPLRIFGVKSPGRKMTGEEEDVLCTYLLIYLIIFCQRCNLLTENMAVFLGCRHERKEHEKKGNLLCHMIK